MTLATLERVTQIAVVLVFNRIVGLLILDILANLGFIQADSTDIVVNLYFPSLLEKSKKNAIPRSCGHLAGIKSIFAFPLFANLKPLYENSYTTCHVRHTVMRVSP
jgi:hypothetical protein